MRKNMIENVWKRIVKKKTITITTRRQLLLPLLQ